MQNNLLLFARLSDWWLEDPQTYLWQREREREVVSFRSTWSMFVENHFFSSSMDNPPTLERSDSTCFICCYGNDVYSFQVGKPQSVVIFFPGDLQDEDAIMYSWILCYHSQVPICRCKSISRLFLRRNFTNLTCKISIFKVWLPNSLPITFSIFIIRPSHKSKEISMYGEYLDCDEYGNVRSCKICR